MAELQALVFQLFAVQRAVKQWVGGERHPAGQAQTYVLLLAQQEQLVVGVISYLALVRQNKKHQKISKQSMVCYAMSLKTELDQYPKPNKMS